jgi:hypothetical protein
MMILSSSLVRSIQACLSASTFSSEILSTSTSHFHTTKATIAAEARMVRRRKNEVRFAMSSFACKYSTASSKTRVPKGDRVYGFLREVGDIRVKFSAGENFHNP